MELIIAIIVVIVFSIVTIGLIKWAITQPKFVKIISVMLFTITLVAVIAWGVRRFL
jgi:hypothetical protein